MLYPTIRKSFLNFRCPPTTCFITGSRQTSLLPRRSRNPQLRPQRTLTTAPKTGDGPLLERRSDRALPDIRPRRSYLYSVPTFLTILGISAVLLFNYQKQSSSVVSSTLYALRTHSKARELLGDNIQFKSKFPWITGELDQLHGVIDIYYDVKGNKSDGTLHFKSVRKSRMGLFETEEWELIMKDGRLLKLLDDPKAADPFPQELPTTLSNVKLQ